MLRWVVRALSVVTVAVVVVMAAGGLRPHGSSSGPRLIVDLSAAPRPAAHRASGAASGAARETAAERRGQAACAGVTVAHEIVVDIKAQHLWACFGPTVAYSSPVTTGARAHHDATPTGTWQIYAKETNRWLSGPGYSDKVHFWMPFHGAYGLHDAPWQTMPFGSRAYPTGGSRGCVHVPTPVMAELYKWAPVGATVHIVAH